MQSTLPSPYFVFHRVWTPFDYLIWPKPASNGILALDGTTRGLAYTLLALSLPFVAIGVTLTLWRLRDAGISRLFALVFFVPLLNLFLIMILSVIGSKPTAEASENSPFTAKGSVVTALAVGIALSVVLVLLGVGILKNYGAVLFVGGPFCLGFVTVLRFNRSGMESLGTCIGVSALAVTVTGVVILILAMEGLICLLMAAPIVYPLAIFGGCMAYCIQFRKAGSRDSRRILPVLLFSLPALMAAECASQPEPPVWEVRTTIEIDATPETVWKNVVAFPPIPEPEDWFFKTGIAYPQRAEIIGSGKGAVRHCIFSTGTFVEPIDEWDESRVLGFTVVEQPPPMREWSPYDIEPPHLDNYLVSRRGEFRLIALDGGRTRLEATTWYVNRIWPQDYWRLWSDYIIHRIHERVLVHIRTQSEQPN